MDGFAPQVSVQTLTTLPDQPPYRINFPARNFIEHLCVDGFAEYQNHNPICSLRSCLLPQGDTHLLLGSCSF